MTKTMTSEYLLPLKSTTSPWRARRSSVQKVSSSLHCRPSARFSTTFVTYNEANFREILTSFSVIYDGKNRENEMNSDVYSYIEKYRNSRGSTLNNGLYYYNHCLLTSPYETQPSGAINLTKFNKVEIELKTITPPIDTEAQTLNICSEDGELIGVNKNSWDIYQYTYDFKLFEERYNVLLISNGTASLKFSL